MYNAVIGIDPGRNGGIVVIPEKGKAKAIRMPETVQEVKEYLEWVKGVYSPIVFIEKMSIRASDVAVEGGAVNMGKLFRLQKLMENYAQLKAEIEATGIPYVMVHPMSWQAKLKLRRKGETKTERKNRYKEEAGRVCADIKPTLWNADAVLIATFGWWALTYDFKWVLSNLPKKEQNIFKET